MKLSKTQINISKTISYALRHKRGEIVDKDPLTKKICLEIETVNTCDKNGCQTLIGVIYPHGYEKIWFNEDELSNFETYNENGDLIRI